MSLHDAIATRVSKLRRIPSAFLPTNFVPFFPPLFYARYDRNTRDDQIPSRINDFSSTRETRVGYTASTTGCAHSPPVKLDLSRCTCSSYMYIPLILLLLLIFFFTSCFIFISVCFPGPEARLVFFTSRPFSGDRSGSLDGRGGNI